MSQASNANFGTRAPTLDRATVAARFVVWQPERAWVCPITIGIDPRAPAWLPGIVDQVTAVITKATQGRITYKRTGTGAGNLSILWEAPGSNYIGYTTLIVAIDKIHWGAAQIDLDPKWCTANQAWVFCLILHELLHALGLGHDKDNMDAVLEILFAIGPDTQAGLNELCKLYPAPVVVPVKSRPTPPAIPANDLMSRKGG